jgi:hypothetical protein
MPAKSRFPGRQRCVRENGQVSLNWVRSKAARAAGYPILTRNLDDYEDRSQALSDKCHELQAEQDKWLAEQKEAFGEKLLVFDGTINSVFDNYETHRLSPYKKMVRTSRSACEWQVKVIRQTVGARRVEALEGIDFLEWYWNYRTPKKEGDPDTIRKAHAIMGRFRAGFTFAALLGLPHAKRLRDALALCEFENAPARTQQVTYHQTVAFIAKAHGLGCHDMALAQALQFELTLRQTDVIGKYETKFDAPDIEFWVSGIQWDEIASDGTLSHMTGKKKRPVHLPTNAYPLVRAEFARFPELPKTGPIVLDSKTGKPFRYAVYKDRWREIADAAGIPPDVWNRDTRAGGVTEAGDAGADKEDMRQHAGHANARMTERYNRPSAIQSRRVADLRVLYREQQQNAA